MLQRKIEGKIQNWLSSSNKALLITGVRQAGKTFTIRKCLSKFTKDNDKNFVEFNLIEQPDVAELISNSTSTKDLILKLSLYCKEEINPFKTIIFFDEIQKCKDIITKIKFLCEDGKFQYIMSGSLLGVEISGLKSAPVGYLQIAEMYPLDFEEFLQIFNPDKNLIDNLKEHFENKNPIDEGLHNKLIEIFNLYLIVGGMPAAVDKYKATSNIDNVISIHKDIIKLYKIDFTQYELENKKLQVSHIYDLLPAELNKQNKRFLISDISKNLRYERIEDSFTWLWKSGVALGVFNVTEPVHPLILNMKSNLFKMFLSDVGLLTTMYGKTSKLKIVTNDENINNGAVYENFVAQELYARGNAIYYYNSKKYGELDFVLDYKDKCLPIEVKSGKDYNRHSALNNVMKIDSYKINEGYVLYNKNIQTEKNITYMPIYMCMFFNETEQNFTDINIERYSF